ncbi:hypothetical protein EB796_001501 [Bugula neritina]|uniref:Uncharacterized protein n=1 Tax=Bugula neritina TaxID=10212 RepID=A0A7J7KQ16_BUGNE|nr:hypothetical protein EB796_001501 [Bugula neritina]
MNFLISLRPMWFVVHNMFVTHVTMATCVLLLLPWQPSHTYGFPNMNNICIMNNSGGIILESLFISLFP